jgi:lipoprotein-releasing system permease protein
MIRDSVPGNRYDYSIRTIKDEKGTFLAALQLEKTMMMIILGLLIIAGIAGIWVTSYLLVKSKSRSIGMLRAMGMSMRSVLIIFTGHSMLIGFLSAAIGGALGIFFSRHLERTIQLVEDLADQLCHLYSHQCAPVHLIPRQIYYFDHLPVNTDISFIFGIAMVTLILSGFAGYFPARQAARMDPVQTIRND